jgi:hypothetical protein
MKSQGEERSRNIEDEMMMKRDNGEGFKDPRSQVAGLRLRVTSLRLQATGYKLRIKIPC